MASPTTLQASRIADLRARLAAGMLPERAGELIGVIRELEELKSTIAGIQAAATVAFDGARRAEDAAAGVPARRQGRSVASEIALARRESPHRGQSLVGLAKALHHEMPHTGARLRDGVLSEWRAVLLARETACLDVEHRGVIDEAICGDPAALEGLGTHALVGKVKQLAATLDPAALVKRARKAEAERTVTIRPAPDTMTYLTGLLPVAQGVAVHATLAREADSLRAAGDQRAKGALMADLPVSRVTGVDLATGEITDPAPPAMPVTVNVAISDESLAGGHQPAEVSADSVASVSVPAEVARLLIAGAATAGVAAWFRRLYLAPDSGALIAMTSRQRLHTDGMAAFLAQRDRGICRTPYCDAPIRHNDHIAAHGDGGQTSIHNGQGLCEACNHAKLAPGWQQHATSRERERHTIEIATPTGQRHRSRAPDPVGWSLIA